MKHQDVEALPKVSQLKLDLIAAKALIDTPEKWCQGTTSEFSPDGRTGRCSVGALIGVNYRRKDNGLFLEAYRALLREVPLSALPASVEHFNDTHTHAEVMALWDKTIEKA